MPATQSPAESCGEIVGMRELVEHPCLAQRERALAEMLVKHAELAGIETAEAADRGDLAVENGVI